MSRAKLRPFLAPGNWFVLLACLLAGSLAGGAQSALAQLAHARLHAIFPPGGQAGSEVEVEIDGQDLDEVDALRFSHPGITARQQMLEPDGVRKKAEPITNAFVVNIADNVPSGIYEMRASGRFGISNPRAFVVGAREELIEDGRPDSPEEAIPLKQGVTINGRADRDRVDYYRLPLKQGEEVLIECFGEKIDSRIDPLITLLGPLGRELLRVHNTGARDAVLNFTAPRDGDYVVGVSDFLYGGGSQYPYRLSCDAGMYIDAVFPPVGTAGKTQQVTVYGRNLPGGKPVAGPLSTRRRLEQATARVKIPAASDDDHRLRAMLPPHCAAAIGRPVSLELGGSKTNPVTLYGASAAVIVEQEPANNREPQKINVPCEYVGQFYPARDRDVVQFEAKAGEEYWIEVFAHRLGSASDPRLILERVLTNDEGEQQLKEIAVVDDPQYSSDTDEIFSTGSYDPNYRLEVKEDGVYRLRLKDLYGSTRSDPRVMYRLVIQKQQPDFQLVAFPRPTKSRNDTYPKATVLRRGGHAAVQLRVLRYGGATGDIQVTAEGLPQGVTCEGAKLGADVERGWLVFAADEKAKAWSGTVKIVAKAMVAGKEIVREARGGTLLWEVDRRNNLPVSRLTRRLGLSVIDAEQAPITIEAGDGKPIETSPGATVKIPVKVAKHGEVKGNIQVTPVALHRDMRAQAGSIKSDDGEVSIELRSDNMPLGSYSFYLEGTAKVRYERNQDAVERAKSRQQEAEAALAEYAEALKKAVSQRDAASKVAQAAADARKKVEAEVAAAKKEVESAAAALEQAEAQLRKAEGAGDEETPAVKEARQSLDEAKKQKQQADDALRGANVKLAAVTKADEQAQAEKKQAEQSTAEAEQMKDRAESYKNESDSRLKQSQDRNKPRDVDVIVVSSPVQLRIVAHPLKVDVESAGKVKQGEKLEVAYSVERLHGFDGTVSADEQAPRGVKGVSLASENLAKGKQQGKLTITAAADATPGKHTATLELSCRQGRVNHELEFPVEFEVLKVKQPEKE
ncbi:MAG: hypothetical protein RIC55_30915 [Pirellulaceae bacterium]